MRVFEPVQKSAYQVALLTNEEIDSYKLTVAKDLL
jgi:hypothetical protein